MRFQFAFPVILTASLFGSMAPALAQGTGDYAAPIPAGDIRAGLARQDEYLSRRNGATTGSAISAYGEQPVSVAPRRRHPVKKADH